MMSRPESPTPSPSGTSGHGPGKRVAAFFDMDRTVLRINSGTRWIRFLHERRELELATFLRSVWWTLQYRLSILDMETAATRLVEAMAGDPEDEMLVKTRLFVDRHVLPSIAPLARDRIAEHRDSGHQLVILTSSTPYIAEPLARHLDMPHVICTRLHVADGRFLGTCERPTCYGPGKVYHAERFAAEHDINLAESYFYTDSYSDLPMLLRVGHRRVINPDGRLSRYAKRSGWPMETW